MSRAVLCSPVLLLLLALVCSGAVSPVRGASCSWSAGGPLRARSQFDAATPAQDAASSSTTVILFTGAPLRYLGAATSGSVTGFDVYVSKLPAQFLLQLYSNQSDAASGNVPRLTLTQSIRVAFPASDTIGIKHINVKWPFKDGDIAALTFPAQQPVAVPWDPLGPADELAHQPQSWITVVNGQQSMQQIGQRINAANAAASYQRVYSFSVTTDQDCSSAAVSSPVCGFAPPLSVREQSDESSGLTTLLPGLSFLVPDVLVDVQLHLVDTNSFDLQLWNRAVIGTADVYTLKRTRRVSSPVAGVLLVSLGWPVGLNDVIGWSPVSPSGVVGISYDDDVPSAARVTSAVVQFDAVAAGAVQAQPGFTWSTGTGGTTESRRLYSVQLYVRTACALSVLPQSDLRSLAAATGAAGQTVLLMGTQATSDAFVPFVQVYVQGLRSFHLQLYSATARAGQSDLYTLKYTLRVPAPSVAGLLTLQPDWPVHKNDVLALASDAGQVLPVFSSPDATQLPSSSVLFFGQTVLVPSGTLPAAPAPMQDFRIVNVKAVYRPYGICSGAGSVPANGNLGSCAFVSALPSGVANALPSSSLVTSCSFACNSGYHLTGDAALTCSSSSSGALSGSQACAPDPCSVVLGSGQGASLGSCNATIAADVSCEVQCLAGFLSAQSRVLTCRAGRIQTDFVKCALPQACQLPASLPSGATFGNCSKGAQMPHLQSCTIALKSGYQALDASTTLTCFNGVLSPLPRVLLNPCTLPALTDKAEWGSCAEVIGSDAKGCNVTCAPGYLMKGSPSFQCTDGVLKGAMPECSPAPSCPLPVTVPEGTEAGSCAIGGQLHPAGESCTLATASGYTRVNGSLTLRCDLGVLSPLPTIIASPCTLPARPANTHAGYGSCATGVQSIPSGSVCSLACDKGYETSDVLSFSCNFGQAELGWSWPKCHRPVCQLPLSLPVGLTYGTCAPGQLLRNDADGFSSACVLSLAGGWKLESGSLTLTCTPDGTLSNLPVVAQGMQAKLVTSSCEGPANFAAQPDIALLQFAGVSVCPAGSTVLHWQLVACSISDDSAGVAMQVACADNVLVDPNAPTSTHSASCFNGPLAGLTDWGTAECPADSAVVGVGWVSCGGTGASLSVVCQPLRDDAARDRLVRPNAETVSYAASCPASGVFVILATLISDLYPVVCPYNSFNYIQSVQAAVGSCVNRHTAVVQNIQCREYVPSLAGLLDSVPTFYGPAVKKRQMLDAPLKPQCIIFGGMRVQSSGSLFSVRFWADDLGLVTFQSYVRSEQGDYVVQGSFAYQVTSRGYHAVGVPSDQTWEITPEHYLGFCYGNKPLIAGDPALDWVKDKSQPDEIRTAYAIAFEGSPVDVGESCGGGGDSAFRPSQQLFYPVQFGVQASPSLLRFGFNVSNHDEVDTLTGGNCLLLLSPRIPTSGRVTGFKFFAKSNTGVVHLQTYRLDGNGVPRLQGSYLVQTLRKGLQSVQLEEEEQWSVEAGDVLGQCYTRSSIAFAWIQNPIEQISDPSRLLAAQYARGDVHAPGSYGNAHWLSYQPGIQTSIGEQVMGSEMGLAFYANQGQYRDRVYALQVDIHPAVSCTSLPREAQFGFGTVDCTATECTLTCGEGYGTTTPTQTCLAGGAWSEQGVCQPIAMPVLEQSRRLPDLDPYSLRFRWQSKSDLPSGVVLLGWELSTELRYPTGKDMELEALEGLLNVTGSRIFPPTTTAYTRRTDLQEEVEHVQVHARIRMLVSGGMSRWAEGVFLPPCACDLYRALRLEDPFEGTQFGTPLDVSMRQNLNPSNDLLLTFTPNSLCADQYEVQMTAVDGTDLGVKAVLVGTFHANTAKSCSFFHPTTNSLTRVAYPMHGRAVNFCVRALPMPLCGQCQSQYNSGANDLGAMPTPVCVTYTPYFSVGLGGQVGTLLTRLSPISQPVGGVTIKAFFTDATGNPVGQPQETWTDVRGEWRIRLASRDLAQQTYGVRVEASRVDVNELTGETMSHEFQLQTDPSLSVFEKAVKHDDTYHLINFFDLSQVPVTGAVQLGLHQNRYLYGSDAFQGCGVSNLTIDVYDANDVNFQKVLASSDVTGKDGAWSVSVPMFRTLMVRPRQDGVNRTFVPPFLIVEVGSAMVRTEPFEDTTVVNLQLEIDGGNCDAHIGSIRPTVFYDACGESAHVLLPAFADGFGYQYILPAVSMTVKLFDSKNPFSGLQSEDLDGTRLPNAYLNGEVFTHISRITPFAVDYGYDLSPQAYRFKYFAIPVFALSTPPMCRDPKAEVGRQQYLFFPSAAFGQLQLTAVERYGFVGTGGEDRTFVCRNVTSAVDILDGVTAADAQLLPVYQQAYGCRSGSDICTIPTVVGNDGVAKVTYSFVPGPIQQSDFRTDNTNLVHTQPAYSRVLQYRLTNSALPWQTTYVVITGTTAVAGVMSILYPPSDPLYILRDPPGGNSYASIESGRVLETATRMSIAGHQVSERGVVGGGGANFVSGKCDGTAIGLDLGAVAEMAVASCDWELNIQVLNWADSSVEKTTTSWFGRDKLNKIDMKMMASTPVDPDIVDGDGDMFLTLDATFALEQAYTVAVEFATLNGATECAASLTPDLTWSLNDGAAYQWVSQRDVKKVIIHDLELTNQLLLESHHAVDLTDLIAKDTTGEDVETFRNNLQAIAGWQEMLQFNQDLKDQAEVWTDFYNSLVLPGTGGGEDVLKGNTWEDNMVDPSKDATRITSIIATEVADVDEVADADINRFKLGDAELGPNWNKWISNAQHAVFDASGDPEKRVTSITYYGTTERDALAFRMRASSDRSTTRQVKANVKSLTESGSDSLLTIVAIGIKAGHEINNLLSISHGTDKSFAERMSNEIFISLGDEDPGDLFQVEVYRDRVFGSPVWKVVSGQSRCPVEKGTVARDAPELIVSTPAFSHVNPDAVVSTELILLNHSPTHEAFTYGLSVEQATNRGLKLYINGQVLSSSDAALQLTLTYPTNVRMTLEARKGEAGFDFNDIQLKLRGRGKSKGTCASANAQISVSYDQPCSAIAFAGYLSVSGEFMLNHGTVSASGAAALSVAIKNPEASVTGRSWREMLQAGYLTDVRVEYRRAGPSKASVLSDSDWQAIKRYGEATPNPPLIDVIKADLSSAAPSIVNDLFVTTWDTSTLGDGRYQLRAVTQCRVPLGALDTSLYTRSTSILTGTVDVSVPRLFGAPLPGVTAWLPGQPISATFTKPLACDSYYGKARVEAWVNPTLVAGSPIAGTPIDMLYVCEGNTIRLQPYAPIYANLVSRLISVRVDRLVDTSGNPIQNDFAEWSFKVAPFDARASAVQVAGLRLNVPLATLLASDPRFNTVNKLQGALSNELAHLINARIDAELRPTPPASTSINGVQPGSLVISALQTSSDAAETQFTLTIAAVPEFPGDAPLPYAPSFFARFLTLAVANRTFEAPATYPLLSKLTNKGANSLTSVVFVVSEGPLAGNSVTPFALQRRSMHTLATPAYTLSKLLSGLGSGVVSGAGVASYPFATVQLTWVVQGEALPLLALSNLRISFLTLPDATFDPDDLNAATRITLTQGDDEEGAMLLASNVQQANGRALYSLQMFKFPTLPGGFLASIRVEVLDAAGQRVLYTVEESTFIVGPPTAPVLQAVKQTSEQQLQITFLPSLRSGVSSANEAASVHYVLSITPAGATDALTVPSSLVQWMYVTPLGVPTTVATLNLTVLAQNLSLPLPAEGDSMDWLCQVTAVSVLASAPPQFITARVESIPGAIGLHRMSQTARDKFEVQFFPPRAADLLLRLSARIDGVVHSQTWEAQAASLPVVGTALTPTNHTSSLLAWKVQLPARTTAYASVEFAVQAVVVLGISPLRFQAMHAPAFLSAPRAVQVLPLSLAFRTGQSIPVRVTWQAPAVITPAGPQLLHSFVLSYSSSDGGALSTGELPLTSVDATRVTQLPAVWETEVPVTYLQSVLPNRATTITIHIRARMYISDNIAVLYRDDETGQRIIQSEAASASFDLAQPSVGQGGGTADVNQIDPYASKYLAEGNIPPVGAPRSPVGLLLTAVSADQVRVSFPVSGGEFPVDAYVVSWYNATVPATSASGVPTPPLGTVRVPSSQQVDGVVTVLLVDMLQHVVAPQQSATFKVGVAAVNQAGASQRAINYIQLAPRVSSDASYSLLLSTNTEQACVPILPVEYVGRNHSGWNCTLPTGVPVVTVRLVPNARKVQAIQALFTHSLLPNTPFPQCSISGGSGSDPQVLPAGLLPLTPCSGYAIDIEPLVNAPNVLYLSVTAEDWSVTESRVHFELADGVPTVQLLHHTRSQTLFAATPNGAAEPGGGGAGSATTGFASVFDSASSPFASRASAQRRALRPKSTAQSQASPTLQRYAHLDHAVNRQKTT